MSNLKQRIIKCSCGRNNKIFCPECSKIKMVICLKNGYDHLKTDRGFNPAWYSVLKYNSYNSYKIVEKMEASLRKSALSEAANVLLFYANDNRHHPIKKVIL